jgi:hypothetical protein
VSEAAIPVDAARALSRTAWSRNVPVPLRTFLQTEVSGAVSLLAATVAALVWVNSPWGSTYDDVWSTELSLRVGGVGLDGDVTGTPSFFVNGRHHEGAYDLETLSSLVREALALGQS